MQFLELMMDKHLSFLSFFLTFNKCTETWKHLGLYKGQFVMDELPSIFQLSELDSEIFRGHFRIRKQCFFLKFKQKDSAL